MLTIEKKKLPHLHQPPQPTHSNFYPCDSIFCCFRVFTKKNKPRAMLWCFWIGYTRLRQPQKKQLVFSACLTLDSAIKTPASCHTTNQWLLDIFNSFKAHPNPPDKQPKEKKATTQKQSTLFNNIIPSSESSPPKKISPNPPKQPNMSLKMGIYHMNHMAIE